MIKNILLLGLTAILIATGITYYKLSKGGDYPDGILRLGMNSTAHLMCSCLFVSTNDEAFCREYSELKQVSPWINVNWNEKQVEARLFLIFTGKAKYAGENIGCKILK